MSLALDHGGQAPPLDERYFVSRDVLAKAFASVPKIDYEKFIEDIDAYVDQDPTPRGWDGF